MDFNRLKELVKKLGGILVLDGNEPEFVMLPYESYEKLEAGEDVPIESHGGKDSDGIVAGPNDQSTVDKLNQEIMALKEEIRQKESAELLENDAEEETFAETVDLD